MVGDFASSARPASTARRLEMRVVVLLVLMMVNQAAAFATGMRETRNRPENDDTKYDSAFNGHDQFVSINFIDLLLWRIL